MMHCLNVMEDLLRPGVVASTHPDILSRLALRTSSPMFMMLRPIAESMKGPILSIVAAGPAMENMSLPAAAMGLAPNTGEAMNVVPL